METDGSVMAAFLRKGEIKRRRRKGGGEKGTATVIRK